MIVASTTQARWNWLLQNITIILLLCGLVTGLWQVTFWLVRWIFILYFGTLSEFYQLAMVSFLTVTNFCLVFERHMLHLRAYDMSVKALRH